MPLPLYAPLPDFEGATGWINGEPTRESLAGRPVLVHFWSAGCHLCKQEFPILNFLLETYGKDGGFRMIGIHSPRTTLDLEEGLAETIVREEELGHPVLIDNRLTVTGKFGNEYVPAYYLFDENLKLRHYQAGEHALRMVEQRLRRVISRMAQDAET